MSGVAILFAAGRGGSPARHARLIARMEAESFAVAAPTAPMLAEMTPAAAEIAARAEALHAAIAAFPPDARIIGIGHSIGASILTAMAGATMWLAPGQPVPIARTERLAKLALLAPPTGFFKAPGALEALRLPLLLCSGGADRVTPPTSHTGFVAALPDPAQAEHLIEADAGHFSFMDTAPPGQAAAFGDEAAFRERLYDRLVAFAAT